MKCCVTEKMRHFTLQSTYIFNGVFFYCFHYIFIIHIPPTKEVDMVTNPVGRGTKTIGINMSDEMAEDLEARADSMHISKSKYCKIILHQWLQSGKKLTLAEKS